MPCTGHTRPSRSLEHLKLISSPRTEGPACASALWHQPSDLCAQSSPSPPPAAGLEASQTRSGPRPRARVAEGWTPERVRQRLRCKGDSLQAIAAALIPMAPVKMEKVHVEVGGGLGGCWGRGREVLAAGRPDCKAGMKASECATPAIA